VTTPATYVDTRAWPLIFGLHGDEGSPTGSVNNRWRAVTNDQFIFVAPQAPNVGGSWYAATAPNSVWMDALLAQVMAQYNIDLDRVSIWGLSGGSVFISTYALARQDVFAAVEFNMGGSGRRYVAPRCKIPARFVTSLTDFLRMNAMGLYDTLTMNGHETVWVDANCMDHCFDPIEAGVKARDWLLAHTLCGAMPTEGCRPGAAAPDGGSTPADASPAAPRDAGAATADTAPPPGPSPPPADGGTAPPDGRVLSSGCALGASTPEQATGWLWPLALLAGVRLARRRR
jgi:hypothetical protein